MRKLFAVCCTFSLAFAASAEVEYLDYVDTTGTQWVDTKIVPYRPTLNVFADFAILEKPSANVALFGVTRLKDQPDKWESSTPGTAGWSYITSFAFFVGSAMNATWTGGSFGQGGYVFNYSANERKNISGSRATVYNYGTKAGGGYYDKTGNITTDSRYQYVTETFYVGNVNNAGTGIYTAEGSMPKTRWYGFKLTDGSQTLCELVPARDGEAIGFYDKVSGKMLTSESDDPFVAPAVFVWKGGGTTAAWTDGSNWEGGVAPGGDIVRIPDNCKAVATTSDIAAMNAYARIELAGDGTVLSFSNMTAGVQKALTVPIRGMGLILVERAASTSDEHNLQLNGANGGFHGNVRVENAGLYIGSRPSVGTGTLRVSMTGSQRLVLAFSGALTNDCYIGGGSMVIPQPSCNPELSGAIHQTGNLSFRGYASSGSQEGWLILSGSLIRDVNSALSLGDALDFRIPRLDLSTQSATVWANGGTKRFRGGIRSLGKTAYAEGTWVCMEAQAFDPKFGGTVRWGTNSQSLTFDMNGFDQSYGKVNLMFASAYCPNFIITSAKRATLTLCDGFSETYRGRIRGAASFELNSTNNATAGSAKFANGNSETTGGFTARRGTIELMGSATFSNVTHLVAANTGLLKVGTADIGNATNLFVAVTNATTAKIEIASGLTLKAGTAYMGTAWLDAGRYSSAASEGVRACPQLSGAGILEVRNYGGKKGFAFVLR